MPAASATVLLLVENTQSVACKVALVVKVRTLLVMFAPVLILAPVVAFSCSVPAVPGHFDHVFRIPQIVDLVAARGEIALATGRRRRRSVHDLHHVLPGYRTQGDAIDAVELRDHVMPQRYAVLEHQQAVGLYVAVSVQGRAHRPPRRREIGRQVVQRIGLVGVGDGERVTRRVGKADDAATDAVFGDQPHRRARGQPHVGGDRARGQVQSLALALALLTSKP
ncbi:MAG: hypothetical protein IPL73_25305 [Candidatus Obscuribacter sp.]|nr:hypothetical protein [Candidatus Obscuribacter sp.]